MLILLTSIKYSQMLIIQNNKNKNNQHNINKIIDNLEGEKYIFFEVY